MGYLLDHCHFDKLSNEIINHCQPFSCEKDADIDSFFHAGNTDNFSDYRDERMAVSHCFYTDEPIPRMVCAFSLSSTALRVDNLSSNLRNRFNRKKRIPNSKRCTQYPAVLIGQLCVFDGFESRSFPEGNVGKEMMDLIKTIALDPKGDYAIRYLVVDATNHPKVLDFYKRNGFEFLFENETDEYDYMVEKRKWNRFRLWINSLFGDTRHTKQLKTRLMFFDLILLKT